MSLYKTICFLVLSAWVVAGMAVDLKDLIADAKQYDTAFISSGAKLAEVGQEVLIARSSLLPQLSLSYSHTHHDQKTDGLDAHGESHQYGLSLTQSIINPAYWRELRKSHIAYQQALVSFEASKQQMLSNVATSYVSVLMAIHQLDAERVKVRALSKQYQQTRQRFNAGIVAKPEFYSARSHYLIAKSEMVAMRVKVRHTINSLSEVTGKAYRRFSILGVKLPLQHPIPKNVEFWEKLAIANNLALKVAEKSFEIAKQAIEIEQASGYPTVSLTGSYMRIEPWVAVPVTGMHDPMDLGLLTLSATWPIFTGGRVSASVEQ